MVLDENLPIYRFRPSSDDPLASLLYFTNMGSEPSAEYLLKRPPPSQAHNRYAIGLFDVQYASVLYAEALIKPEWSQPTLSAAEVRANGGTPVSLPVTPQSFAISLYNPDQTVMIRQSNSSSWSKDAWEFEIPEKSFKLPSASRIDQDDPGPAVADLVPKVNFRWKRDSRMSRDMTCYMSGRTVGGQKNKEPDITVAMFRGGRTESAVAIYEPNMARVEVEDRKGLEVVLLLSAEIIRDLYLAPRQDPFNTAGGPPPNPTRKSSGSPGPHKPLQKQPTIPVASGAAIKSSPVGNAKAAGGSSSSAAADARRQADIDAEKRRIQVLVEQEKEKARERERRDREEQERIKQMLEREEEEERQRRQREIDQETERLRQQYGTQEERRARSPPSPNLPPRPIAAAGPVMSGAGSGWSNTTAPAQPPRPRPQSVGPPTSSTTDHVYSSQQNGGGSGGRKLHKFGQFLQSSPYAGPAAASVSGFFGGANSNNSNTKEDEKRKKAKKKRSVHF